ncbi:DUF1638 domain-containing protein [Methanimicrococcus blatticola]|uniref:Uncharacterized protein DUF1638 n=1 Tax=Methanimicrococcus blatticola TaxID=91560 RepID=A0A484F5X3_9EURY|nr:DUF1638 domain-containing protein [Methanimicrococcus blatticola]MBZ3935091.1 DUF1638 domain-containing protein [Methanimicrococcus blatticola]MCC2508812.1 DUF1638 domain-containing protein [Methanimicrococcus blatticola]TDQ71159.1 uncharacterized protein DUF1638 [Methanimicrococcus blatticola]
MTTIAIVSCRIFEDELTHLMKKEQQEKKVRLFLIETEFTDTIEKKFNSDNVIYEKIQNNRIEEKLKEPTDSQNTILLRLIEFSMEARPSEIKDTVYEKIKPLQEITDGIMVFYGLCGNVLGSIEGDLSRPDCPVRILRDEDGDMGDDCICISLGSRKKYLSILRTDGRQGTYFLTPMQAAHWREIAYASALTPDPNDDEMLKMVFEYSNYKNVGKVKTGLPYENEFDGIVDDFASRFNLNVIEYDGSQSMIEKSFERFMKELEA